MKRYLRLSMLLLSLLICTGGCATNPTVTSSTVTPTSAPAPNQDTAPDALAWNGSLTDWMAALPDELSLGELTIPGTHDSGAIRSDFIGKFSQCQTLSIAEQLSAGVRFLDIRLKLVDESLDVYHGIVDQELTFASVRADCKAFLATHPNEVILMSIKQEDASDPNFPAAIQKAMEEDPDLWYTQNLLPTLGEARGKIVLLRRYSGTSIGINCADGWSDNTDFAMNNGVSMKVQDFYNLDKKDNIAVKWDKIVSLSEFAAKNSHFCLNFTSGYTGMVNISAVSNEINPKLINYFSGKKGDFGTYASDFITAEIASVLIATNFQA